MRLFAHNKVKQRVKHMKEILMFTMATCPYCKRARQYMEEIMEETPKYKDIPLKIIDGNSGP